ncbi:MAG TPA: putative O-glycosylation ligase, exosortase A system-associated [Candidatus Deferrimicrobiaceae bacterium]|nr:putative O-glycosylation ligase, exosortase A system-associated [Candidatus Deferrimicrobiaceae bacterium]
MSPIRDILLLAALIPLVPVCFLRPWIGMVAWFWVAYFVPHSFTWGFARDLPIAMLVGGATLAGFVFTKDRAPLPRSTNVALLFLFAIHVTISTFLAHDAETAWGKWDWVSKSLLMTFVTMTLFQDRRRLHWLFVVVAASFGLHGLKGGLYVLRTGGGNRVFGPERSFFGDNNTFGLALCMALPMLLYLSRQEERVWLKRAYRIMFAFSVIAILFTYSRGAFVGLVVVLGILIWRSPWRMRFAVAVVIAAFVGTALMPDGLKERIGSIAQQDSSETRDSSVAGRFDAWQTATRIASANPVFGEGFRALWNRQIWETFYGQDYFAARDAHSIYFELLAEQGFVGLGLYLAVLTSTLFTLRNIRRRWRGDPEHGYLSSYAEMIQLSLYPFLISGAFLGVAYFDFYFLLVAVSASLAAVSAKAEQAVVAAAAPAVPAPRAARPVPPRRMRPMPGTGAS